MTKGNWTRLQSTDGQWWPKMTKLKMFKDDWRQLKTTKHIFDLITTLSVIHFDEFNYLWQGDNVFAFVCSSMLSIFCSCIKSEQWVASNGVVKNHIAFVVTSKHVHNSLLLQLTLSPRKAEKPASPTVTNSCKAEIPACSLWFIPIKPKYRLGNFDKKLLQIMLCLGAPGLGTPCWGAQV